MHHEIQTPTSTYQFTLWPLDTKFNRIAGIYLFIIIPDNSSFEELVPNLIREELKGDVKKDTRHPTPRHPELVSGSHPENHHQADTQYPAPYHPELAEGSQYSLLYAGITNDFYARLQNHHKIQQAIALGMTHIGILRKSSGRRRKTIERDILKSYNPPLNQTWVQEFQS